MTSLEVSKDLIIFLLPADDPASGVVPGQPDRLRRERSREARRQRMRRILERIENSSHLRPLVLPFLVMGPILDE